MLPQTKGALVVYKKVLSPLFKKHEEDLKKIIDDVKEAASKAQEAATEQVKNAASAENMMKAAAMAEQAKAKMEE